MSPALITLAAWSPFLLLALIFCPIFCVKGYKRGAARAGISIGVTIIACVISIFVSKLIASGVAGSFSPMIADALKSAGLKAGSLEVASLATSVASAFAALIIYIPVFIIFVSVLKPVASLIFKKFIPNGKHIANKIGGLSVSLIDALLLVILVTLPLYGTLALVDDAVGVFGDKDDEAIQYVSAATDPFVVDIASVPPFSTAYDALMSCKIGTSNVSISATLREATELLSHIDAFNDLKNGKFNKKDILALIGSAESLITKNDFAADFICDYLGDKAPSFKVPGLGKIKLDEYYPALSDGKQLKKDLPAFFDLTKAMVKSGMVEALVNKDGDMSKVNADTVAKAFGNTLNHSAALATFKSKLLTTAVDSFTSEIIESGKDKDGSVKTLCDAISAIPTEPMGKEDSKKEGEAFYLLMSGIVTSSNEKTQMMGLGMMLEGLARHPKVGVDTVMNAAGTIMENSGTKLSDTLLNKLEENLRTSIGKPLSENFFGKYCNTAFTTIDAFSGIAGGNKDENGKDSSKESLKNLITSDKEALEAVKDTVSSDLMADMGIDDKHADTFKDVIDATFDSIIDSNVSEEEAEKEAEALGNILGTVTDITENPENTDDAVKEYATEVIDEILDCKVASGMIQKLTSSGKSDPLGLFGDLTDDAKADVNETIDQYIAEAKTEDEIAILEAFKLFVGIKNND